MFEYSALFALIRKRGFTTHARYGARCAGKKDEKRRFGWEHVNTPYIAKMRLPLPGDATKGREDRGRENGALLSKKGQTRRECDGKGSRRWGSRILRRREESGVLRADVCTNRSEGVRCVCVVVAYASASVASNSYSILGSTISNWLSAAQIASCMSMPPHEN